MIPWENNGFYMVRDHRDVLRSLLILLIQIGDRKLLFLPRVNANAVNDVSANDHIIGSFGYGSLIRSPDSQIQPIENPSQSVIEKLLAADMQIGQQDCPDLII
jgi:hypothetical protein